MNNDLTVYEYESSVMEAISSAKTIEDAKAVLKQIKDIKTWLDLADKFREESIKYAQLEATALIVIVKKGMGKAIGNSNNKRRRAAEWLCSLSEEEQNLYIGMCKDGLLIEQIWWREVGQPEQKQANLERAAEIKKEAVEYLKEDGFVDLTTYAKEIRCELAMYDVADDVIDGMRNDLRKAGGVGSWHSMLYVLPERGKTDELVRAMRTRIDNIISTAKSLVELCKVAKVKVDIDEITRNVDFVNNNFSLFLWLDDIGAIDASLFPEMGTAEKARQNHFLEDRKRVLEEELADVQEKIELRECLRTYPT